MAKLKTVLKPYLFEEYFGPIQVYNINFKILLGPFLDFFYIMAKMIRGFQLKIHQKLQFIPTTLLILQGRSKSKPLMKFLKMQANVIFVTNVFLLRLPYQNTYQIFTKEIIRVNTIIWDISVVIHSKIRFYWKPIFSKNTKVITGNLLILMWKRLIYLRN